MHLEMTKSSLCRKIRTLKTPYRLHSHSNTIPLTPKAQNDEGSSLLSFLFRDFESLLVIAKKYTISGILMVYIKITANITYFDKRTGKTLDLLTGYLYDSQNLLIGDMETFFNYIVIIFIH